MKGKTAIVVLLIFFGIVNLFAQTDSLIIYNTETRQLITIPPVVFDTSIVFDNTEWNTGEGIGISLLDLNPPTVAYNNSKFTDLVPVQKIFPISNYPASSAVQLFAVVNDTLKHKCSGILVSKKVVLTSCHCVAQYDTNGNLNFVDSIRVFPAYDNGNENLLWGKSSAIEYITFISKRKRLYPKDIALIKLEDEIGIKAGWMGIAFSKDDDFFRNKVFHKLSYPAAIDFSDSSRIYNGDTLYYNYGVLDLIDSKWLGYNIVGIPGQSGSSLFYTDNEIYYSVGTLAWAGNSKHVRITPEIFYSFKSVLDNTAAEVDKNHIPLSYYHLSDAYPNPFNPATKISFIIPGNGRVQLKVYDLLGKEICTLVDEVKSAGKYEIIFNAGSIGKQLPSGVYFIRMQSGNFISTKKIILLW